MIVMFFCVCYMTCPKYKLVKIYLNKGARWDLSAELFRHRKHLWFSLVCISSLRQILGHIWLQNENNFEIETTKVHTRVLYHLIAAEKCFSTVVLNLFCSLTSKSQNNFRGPLNYKRALLVDPWILVEEV